MKIRSAVTGMILCSLAWAHPVTAQAKVPELLKCDMKDVAVVSWFTGAIPQLNLAAYDGPVIYVNPDLSAELGEPLTAFFLTHVVCHVNLGHVEARFFAEDPWSRTWVTEDLELKADDCAIRTLLSRGKLLAAKDAFYWFQGEGPNELLPFFAPAKSRADNILNTARVLGKNLQ